MPHFLSAEWLAAFDDVVRADATLGARFAANPIAIGQEVTMADPAGVVRYVVVLDGAGGRIVSGAAVADHPGDVTFVCDRETAAELAQGAVNAQGVLTSGRLKVRGDIDRLGAASAALGGLGDLLGQLRADTSF